MEDDACDEDADDRVGRTNFVVHAVDMGSPGTAGPDEIGVGTDASGVCSYTGKLGGGSVTGGNLVVHS